MRATRIAPLVLAGAWLAAGNAHAETSPSAVLARADGTLKDRAVGSLPVRGMEGEDKTLSPYFHVPGSGNAEQLPLKETKVEVQLAGVIAKVKVRQVYENTGAVPIEAVYVFPASTRAAVHGMRMKIGGRTIEARIEKRREAREQYEQAKAQGRRASLLEQERSNVFTTSVANVMPRDQIEVELDYSELLVPEDATYEFVYPTVVGPRYARTPEPQECRWAATPYLSEGEREPYRFDIAVHLETGLPIRELSSPSHVVLVDFLSASSADVRLRDSSGGNRDYVLRYRLAGDRVEAGVLLWKGERDGYFLLMLEPPRRPPLSDVPAREYIFLLDVSGSMSGFPLETSKELMKTLLAQLRPADTFNVVVFSGGSGVMFPEGSVRATGQNVKSALERIGGLRGGGGTELLQGLEAAYGVPRGGPGVARTVVVATDGYVVVEAQAFKFIRERLDQANLFAFGIGTSVNRGLIEGMARAGQGEPFVVLGPEQAQQKAEKLRLTVEKPVLTGVSVAFEGFDAREVTPSRIPDVLAERPVVVLGTYRGSPGGKIVVRGTSGRGSYERVVDVAQAPLEPKNAAVRWLWARKWIELLEDENALAQAKEIEEAITDLGLSHTLLTSYTSFVAVDSEAVNRSGEAQRVNQPVPLPQGVSNQALGTTGPLPSIFGQGGLGGDIKGAGNVFGSGAGDASGFGGLGLRGTGTGGGGSGRGLVTKGGGGGLAGFGAMKSTNGAILDSEAVVLGSLDKELIRQVIRRHIGQIRFCYEQELQLKPGLAGKLVVRFVIGPNGEVQSVKVDEGSTLTDARLGACIVARVRGWRFPSPRGGGSAVVTYPFVFKVSK